NLELARALSGERRGSLLAAIDRTVTAAGSRLLAQRLAAPLTDPGAIERRQDAIEFFVADAAARAELRARLAAAPDLARALARLVLGRGGPRDLAAMRDGILAAAGIADELEKRGELALELAQATHALRRLDPALASELGAALAEELPHLKRDGGFVRTGFDAALEAKIASAADRALAIELETFETLAAAVTAAASAIKEAAEALAVVDVAAALAQLAIERHYVRPQIDASLDFIIEGGRHPVVEQALTGDASAFVANDCDLSPPASAANGRIYLVTGPNMAGKSTYLRQNAPIAIMAQMGSFVPARRPKRRSADRLFSRGGA